MRITWFGHSTFRLDFGSSHVLIDPFFSGNPPSKATARRRPRARPIS